MVSCPGVEFLIDDSKIYLTDTEFDIEPFQYKQLPKTIWFQIPLYNKELNEFIYPSNHNSREYNKYLYSVIQDFYLNDEIEDAIDYVDITSIPPKNVENYWYLLNYDLDIKGLLVRIVEPKLINPCDNTLYEKPLPFIYQIYLLKELNEKSLEEPFYYEIIDLYLNCISLDDFLKENQLLIMLRCKLDNNNYKNKNKNEKYENEDELMYYSFINAIV